MIEVLVEGLAFPEAPRWRDGRLWFSDFYRRSVTAVDMNGVAEVIVEVPGQPSGLGWTPDGQLLVVSMLDRRLTRLEGGALATVADLSGLAAGPANDMVVDAAGRAYVGNMGFFRDRGETLKPTVLACVHPDGRVEVAADEMVFPNGSVISPDGSTLIVAETYASRLSAFDIDDQGRLSGRRVFADLPDVWPDGVCLDEEGGLWVANPKAHNLLRVHRGRIERTVDVGDRKAFACMLGGDDGRTLFICTNLLGGPPGAHGRIEYLKVDAAGAGRP